MILFFLREETFIVNVLENAEYEKETLDQISAVNLINTVNKINTMNIINTGEQPVNIQKVLRKTNNNNANIFYDDVRFSELLNYSTYISSVISPLSWLDLNDQLFCPIRYSHTINSQNTISNGDEILLKILYKLQFLSNCSLHSNKFIILDMNTMATRGLGSVVNAGLLKWIFRAIYSSRTLILTGNWLWINKQNNQYCNDTVNNGMECFFLPISNCRFEDVQPADYTGMQPDYCNLGDNDTLPLCSERVIFINRKNDGWGYFPAPSQMDKWLLINLNVNYNTFRAVSMSFFFRLKSSVRSIIYNKIRLAIRDNPSTVYLNPFNTLSLPIRHSDKCKTHSGSIGEMVCWTENEYILFLDSISYLSNNRINTLIITSESTEFINNLTSAILNYSKWKYTDSHLWRNIILNQYDISSQVGASDYNTNSYHKYDNWIKSTDPRLGSSLKYDPIVGALSSMLLQISNSKYIVHTKTSNWLDLIWSLAKHLNCESIFWSKELEINGFKSLNNNYNYNINRPDGMYNLNKKYLNLNKYCFEFIQWGLANKRVREKSIIYPPDLWEEIKFKKIKFKDISFKNIFGIKPNIRLPCERFSMPPFRKSDTVY